MSLRIMHVIDSIDPRLGGPPAACLRLASAQAQLGNAVSIVTRTAPAALGRVESSLIGIPGMQRVNVRHIDAEGSVIARARGRNLEKWICEHAASTDIVHVHSVWEPAVLAAATACRSSRIPYAITPHGTLDSWGMNRGLLKSAKKRIAMALLFRRVLEGSAFMHMLNEGEREGLDPLALRVRTEVLPNGVFPEEQGVLPPKGTFRRKHPELKSDPYVLFLARLDYMKGLDRLISGFVRAKRHLPHVRLVVAGPDFGAESNARRQCDRLGVADRVHFVGPLYGIDKLAAFADATAYGLISRYEGFSIALLEAMLAGLPVVISRECRFPEVQVHHAGAIVEPDEASVAAALARFLAEPDLARAAGLQARELVTMRYTWTSIGARMVETYQRHLCGGGG